METIFLWFAFAKVSAPPVPPIYVPICIPGHPKCNRTYPPTVTAAISNTVRSHIISSSSRR